MIKNTLIILTFILVFCLLAFCAMQLQTRGVFILGWEYFPILPQHISPKENLGAHAYQTLLSKDLVNIINQSSYPPVIFEDGTPLPIYYGHDIGRYRIGREGAGNYLLQNRRLFFSATDNSDPRSSEKRYEVGIPRRVNHHIVVFLDIIIIPLSLCLLFLVYKAGFLKSVGKAAVIISFNLAIILGLLVCFEIYLRNDGGHGNSNMTTQAQRLPYDSNYARNDLSYYHPDEILDESQGLYTWGIQVKLNSLGFREREIVIPKAVNTYRVVVLGDSLTYGIGIHPEERFTNQTEANLAGTFLQKNLEVLNFGYPGADLEDELDILRKIVDIVQPDLIVIGFCSNDLNANIDLYQIRKKQFESMYGPAIDYILGGMRRSGLSSLAMLSRQALDGLLISVGVLPKIEYSSENLLREDTPEVIAFRKSLMEIKRISDEKGLPAPVFLVLNQTPLTNKPTSYRDLSEHLPVQLRIFHKAEMMAEAVGFKHFNCEKEIIEKQPKILVINEVDDHPSPALNLIYAEKLTSALLQIIK